MDATYLTAIRTGAVSGVATKYLARKDSRKVGIIVVGRRAELNCGPLQRLGA